MARDSVAEKVTLKDAQAFSTTASVPLHDGDKDLPHAGHLETVETEEKNLVYENVDEEPELHARTYIVVAAIVILNIVQVIALQGPPAVLSYIGEDLNNTAAETWVPNALSVPQAVLGPIISSISDTFQVRKTLIVAFTAISFIGAAIAPGSNDIYRLIAAQTLIGFGFAIVPLEYCIPSEILPRKWRPIAQGAINFGACLGSIVGPLTIGALTKADRENGWRTFYWIQMGLWGASTIGIFVAYRPPKRHTRYDHFTLRQKLGHLDLVGSGLLTIGLTLLLTGLNLGGGLYTWTNARVLTTLIIGIIGLITFCFYEWKGTSTGILHHELFRGGSQAGRTFAICLGLICIEGIMLFAFAIFYPILTNSLFETDPFLLVARSMPFWVAACLSTVVWSYTSTKFRTIREPMFVGFLILTAGIVGVATTEPGHSTNLVIFAGVIGIGFGAPLILVITGVQLCSPHHLIATATAVNTSARGVGATIFTSIYSAALKTRLTKKLPDYISKAALSGGLPVTSLRAFVEALASGDTAALPEIPGVTPHITALGVAALRQAYADSLRIVYIIAAPFGVLACIGCLFLGDLRKTMNYRVDAPVEDLHSKVHHNREQRTV